MRSVAEPERDKQIPVDLPSPMGANWPMLEFAKRVERLIGRIRLGPSFPVTIRGIRISFPPMPQSPEPITCFLKVMTRVPERTSGEDIEVVHEQQISKADSDKVILFHIVDTLEGTAHHEAQEGVRVDGQIANDPHGEKTLLGDLD